MLSGNSTAGSHLSGTSCRLPLLQLYNYKKTITDIVRLLMTAPWKAEKINSDFIHLEMIPWRWKFEDQCLRCSHASQMTNFVTYIYIYLRGISPNCCCLNIIDVCSCFGVQFRWKTAVSLLVLWLIDQAATAEDKTGNIQLLVALAVTTVIAIFLVAINYADNHNYSHKITGILRK